MRADLAEVAGKLASERDPMEIAAEWIEKVFSESKETVHAELRFAAGGAGSALTAFGAGPRTGARRASTCRAT